MITLVQGGRTKRNNGRVRRALKLYKAGFASGCENRTRARNEYRPTSGPWADGAREGLTVWQAAQDRQKELNQVDRDFYAQRITADERNAAYGSRKKV